MSRLLTHSPRVLLAGLGLILAACATPAEPPATAPAAAATPAGAHLALVAYSTPQEAYAKLIPAFQQTAAGANVSVDPSFGSSGSQTAAVINGLAADVVALSLASDVTKLVNANLVAADWNTNPLKGMVTDSVVSLVVRKGNPKGIATWDDLLKPGIEVVTPDPFQSGGAKWNILAGYGAKIKEGKSPDAAKAFLKDLLGHVSVQPASGREAMTTFVGGRGDVLISYENEAITAQQGGQAVDYVIPSSTILIENPIAVVKTSHNQPAAQAFVDYLRSPDGQRVWGKAGYRPVLKDVGQEFASAFPVPTGLFTIEDLGGWPAVDKQFFDRDSGMISQLVRELGQVAAPAPAARGRWEEGLSWGLVSTYLSLVVLIPIAALVAQAAGAWDQGAWAAVTNPQTVAALELTVGLSLAVALINVVVGTATAWVLVRDRFPGRSVLDAAIDLPLALPTIVAGLTLLALYGPRSPIGANIAYTRLAILLALLFVTLPFVIRAVQPVVYGLDAEAEDAARVLGARGPTVFGRIALPQLAPALLSGGVLAFARALGEYGSVVLLSGNIPFSTQVASVYIYGEVEQGSPGNAAAISVVLLVLTLLVLVGVDLIQRRWVAHAE
jgi:sulfate/thiosulfate transport system substrate-binding protein